MLRWVSNAAQTIAAASVPGSANRSVSCLVCVAGPSEAVQDPAYKRPSETIPLSVRRKLREASSSIDDEEWYRLPPAAKAKLMDIRVSDRVERRTFAQLAQWLRTTFLTTDHAPERSDDLPDHGDPRDFAWYRNAPPAALTEWLNGSAIDWSELDEDDRFALVEALERGAIDAEGFSRAMGSALASCHLDQEIKR